jgi:hypothetical protein
MSNISQCEFGSVKVFCRGLLLATKEDILQVFFFEKDRNLPFRQLIFTSKLPVLLLLACVLNILLIAPARANEQASEFAELSPERQQEILAWQRMIEAKPDSKYEVVLITGDELRGKVESAGVALVLKKKDFQQSISRSKYKEIRIEWHHIHSIKKTGVRINPGAIISAVICSYLIIAFWLTPKT